MVFTLVAFGHDLFNIFSYHFFSATCGRVFSTDAISHADKPLTSSGYYPFKTTITWTCITGRRLQGHKTNMTS